MNRRASVASRRAYASAPTRVAWNRPAARDRDAARQHLVALVLGDGIGLAGEHRLVELEPVDRAQDPVGRDLVAGARARTDRRARPRSTAISRTSPSRTTRARGAFSTASRSSVRLARYSCTTPMSALNSRTKPKSASWPSPNTRMSTNAVPRIALNRVNTLARRISARVRLVRSSATLTWPARTRCATSSAVSPSGPGGRGGARDPGVAHRQTLPIRAPPRCARCTGHEPVP